MEVFLLLALLGIFGLWLVVRISRRRSKSYRSYSGEGSGNRFDNPMKDEPDFSGGDSTGPSGGGDSGGGGGGND